MTRKTCAIVIAILFATSVWAQENETRASRLQVRLATGPYFSFESEDPGMSAYSHPGMSTSLRFPSVTLFFIRNLGIEWNFMTVFLKDEKSRAEDFSSSMQARYGDRFYIQNPKLNDNNNSQAFASTNNFFLVGPTYRFFVNKLSVVTRFQLGDVWYETYNGSTDLKEKGTNLYWRVEHHADQKEYTGLVLAPGLSVNYPLTDHFSFCLDLSFTHYTINLETEEIVRNQVTTQVITTSDNYRHEVNAMAVQLGLVWEIGKINRKQKAECRSLN